MGRTISGADPLAYVGARAKTPSNFKTYDSAPTSSDSKNVRIGHVWQYPAANETYRLMSLEGGVAFWAKTYSQGAAGQILIGKTDDNAEFGTMTSVGGSLVYTFGEGTINIETSAVGASWTTVTGTSQALEVARGYIPNNAGLVTFTLPATAVVGTEIKIMGLGAGGFKIAQNASQKITHLDQVSTIGVTGYVASTNKYDGFTLRCIETDTHFRLTSVDGNITVA